MLATFAARVKVVLNGNTIVSPEFLLLPMSESCIVCVSVLRPHMYCLVRHNRAL